jgi:WD40 repeat protein
MCDQDRLVQLVQDAQRFIMYHKGAIEGYPLQTYAAALLFSPTGSLIRQLFQHEEPETISIRPALSDGWSACLLTLEGHSDPVSSVAFSHDSARLASASGDRTVKIWDAYSGACLQTLEGHSNYVSSVAFSHDSARLASASGDRTVKIWDAHSGACLQTLEGHSDVVRSVAFSHDSARLASASSSFYSSTVKIWDAHSGACLQTLEGYSDAFGSADLVSILVSLRPDKTAIEPQQPVSRGAAISLNRTWVSNNAQDMVWLPTEYRPDRPGGTAVSGRCVGIGTGSGKVWFCRFL